MTNTNKMAGCTQVKFWFPEHKSKDIITIILSFIMYKAGQICTESSKQTNKQKKSIWYSPSQLL